MSAEPSKQVRGLFGRRRDDQPAPGPSEVETRLQAAEGRAEDAETRVGDLQAELMFYGDATRSLKSELEAVTERVISRVAPQVVELEARSAKTEALRQSVTALHQDAESERAGLMAWRAEMDTLVSSLKGDIGLARAHIDQMPERIRDALIPRPPRPGDWKFDDYVRLDLFYIENWSITYDLFLLLKTVPAILRRGGNF